MARERIYIVFHWAGLMHAFLVLLVFASGFLMRDSGTLTQTLGITLVVAGVVALIQSNDNLRGWRSPVADLAHRVPAARRRSRSRFAIRPTANASGLTVRTGWRIRPFGSVWLPVLEAGDNHRAPPASNERARVFPCRSS